MSAQVVLVQDTRGPGTYDSGPVDVVPGQTQCTTRGIMSDADAGDTAKHMTLVMILVCFDGINWSEAASTDWTGGPDARDPANPPIRPGLSYSWDANYPPKKVMARFGHTQLLNYGATIDLS